MSILMDFLQQYVEDIAIDIKNQKNIVDYIDTYSDFTSKYDVSKPDSLTISVGDYVRVLSDYTNADEIMDYKLTKDSSGNYKFVEDLSALDYADIDDRGGTKLYKNNSIYNPEDWLDEVLLQVDDNNCGYTNIEEVLGDLDSLDMVSSFDNKYGKDSLLKSNSIKIESTSNTSFTFTSNSSATLEYSLDNSTYSSVTKGTAITASNGVIYLRGTGNTAIGEYDEDDEDDEEIEESYFNINCSSNDIKVSGNILNLLDYTNNPTSMNEYAFAYLFYNNTCISDCSKLILPEFTSSYCYQSMFDGCTSLSSAPELPATSLTNGCYYYMFDGCTSLSSVPELPATNLATYCYYGMFSGCISLTSAPALPATTLASYCYSGMFSGCISLTSAPALPATTLADACYWDMFSNCTSLTSIPVLPVTSLTYRCYCRMFYRCTSLTSIPVLPATTLAYYCYYTMFQYCTSIKLSTTKTDEYNIEYRIPSSGTGTTASSALINMFSSTGGTFKGTPSINTTYYTSNTIV